MSSPSGSNTCLDLHAVALWRCFWPHMLAMTDSGSTTKPLVAVGLELKCGLML